MIEARRLSRRFGSLVAVDDVSLRVPGGTLLALLGPNGAGKTTTIRMLSGLLAPSGGTATVAGCDVATEPAGVRARIGLVTDVPGLYEQMTPVAYLRFFGRLYGLVPSVRARRIDDLLRMFDLHPRRGDRMVTFSRGMQQKVALARALLHEPSVLFLDEPTAGLDPLAARSVRELILSLKHARRSIVLCTHDLDEAERLADQVAIMSGGRIVALDSPETLRRTASPETIVRISLAAPLPPKVPSGVLEFRTADPSVENPRVISELVAAGAQIVSVTLSTRSLEDVYATALNGSSAGPQWMDLADSGEAAPLAGRERDHSDVSGESAPAAVRSEIGSVVSGESAPSAGRAPDHSDVSGQSARNVVLSEIGSVDSGESAPGVPSATNFRAGTAYPTAALGSEASAFEKPAAPLPNDASALLLIAWRAALESLNDRMTRLMNVFFALVAPIALLILVVKPLETAAADLAATVLPAYLLVIGMMPAVGAVGIAAGQFAGEKERGVLTPLLASPASNLAIFGGKVLGSVVPPLLYSVIAEAIYVVGIAVLLGADRLALLPPALSVALLLLVPAATCLAAIVGTLVSSRVRTFNAAQQIAGIVLIPLWAAIFALAFRLQDWGIPGLVGTVGGILVLDAALTVVAASTWRREEVLSQK